MYACMCCKSTPRLLRSKEERVRDQADDHDDDAVDGETQAQLAQQGPAPLSAAAPAEEAAAAERAGAPAQQTFGVLIPVVGDVIRLVVFLHEALVRVRLRGGDLVVEQARKDEADARAPRAAHVRQHGFQGRDRHGDDVAQDDDDRGDDGEAGIAHRLRGSVRARPE